MTESQALGIVREKDREIVMIEHILSTLSWDMETVLPEKALGERAEQMAYLSALSHRALTDPLFIEALGTLEGKSLGIADEAILRIRKQDARKASMLPSSLVERISSETAKAHSAWIEARKRSDFSLFENSLSSLIGLTKDKALCIDPDKKPYDVLLDGYEEGMSMSIIDPVFSELGSFLHGLQDRLSDKSVDSSFLSSGYDSQALHAFCLKVVGDMGFDASRGAVGITAHPFTSTLGCDDVRISTRYTDPDLFDPIGSAMHEAGHALYEMAANKEPGLRGTCLAGGASTALHESQSRSWENLVGRSPAFWSFYYPELQKGQECLKGVSLESFVKAINKVQCSPIRVNADEVTYSLHIILRYEVEKAIFSGSVSVSDLPSFWNELSGKILGYTPESDSLGILQDCHWAGGDFGYFPTYALGNIYSCQLLEALYRDEGGKDSVDRALSEGRLSVVSGWQDDRIWSKGRLSRPSDLVLGITGSTLDAGPYMRYLESKCSAIHSI